MMAALYEPIHSQLDPLAGKHFLVAVATEENCNELAIKVLYKNSSDINRPSSIILQRRQAAIKQKPTKLGSAHHNNLV